ncbi:MAG: alpha/beta fold hydrolase [Solirubrobacteraceae bacterium]|nr:alpha/beta fold hydrolase [Solirubrobacteraceae bacterium]
MSRRALRVAAVGLATGCLTAIAAAPASAEVVTIRSFDGTAINAEFLPGKGASAASPAPTVVMTHGFGATRETVEGAGGGDALGQIGASAFRAAGYNTITYDSRGFGRSGGEVQLDSPQFEGRDASAVIDWVAKRPEARLDAAGDPRVGMHGASYGGGVQWAAASRDRRIDAIVPAISWTSLVDALARDDRLKIGWGLPLVGLGTGTGLLLGATAPQGLELGGMPLELVSMAAQGLVTGRAGENLTGFLATRSTGDGIGDVKAPTLILQGTADTLFTPSQAIEARRLLRTAGTPTKVVWFCGGHGLCRTGNVPAGLLQRRAIAWMDRWLREDAKADVGPGFEWVADDGSLRSAADFPLAPAGELVAQGAGAVPITPVATLNGLLVASTPGIGGLDVDLPRVDADRDVVGEPVVRLRYRGTATTPDTHLFAQIVDVERNVVVGNQVTPIPVVLDGRERTVERRLEAVAMRVTPSSRYRLQILDGANLYGLTLAAGSVDVAEARVTLPLGDAAATKADPALTGSGGDSGSATAADGVTAAKPATRRTVRLRTFARRGVALRGAAAGNRRVRVRVVVSRALSRRLGLRSRTLATRVVRARKGSWSVRVRPSKRVAERLGRRARSNATVRVSVGRVTPARIAVRR